MGVFHPDIVKLDCVGQTQAPTTAAPTTVPTMAPTTGPTTVPSMAPTAAPTQAPTATPSVAPTSAPTVRHMLCGDGETPCDPEGRACADGSSCAVDAKAKLFPDFAFIHGAIPTASGIIVFAARYGAECDLVASSSVLVLLAFAPIMFVTVALLGAEDEHALLANVGQMGEIMHCLSIAGSFLLIVGFATSPKWRRHPKTAVFDLAVLSFFFSIFSWPSLLKNGTFPNIISKMRIPTAHQSTASPWPVPS